MQIRIRTASSHRREQAARFGVEIYDMSRWSEAALETMQAPVYVSDRSRQNYPAYAPGVLTPEPGGLSTRDVVSLIHRLPARIVGADLVEYNPDNDVRDLTARVAKAGERTGGKWNRWMTARQRPCGPCNPWPTSPVLSVRSVALLHDD